MGESAVTTCPRRDGRSGKHPGPRLHNALSYRSLTVAALFRSRRCAVAVLFLR
jgi:hypothetical protein